MPLAYIFQGYWLLQNVQHAEVKCRGMSFDDAVDKCPLPVTNGDSVGFYRETKVVLKLGVVFIVSQPPRSFCTDLMLDLLLVIFSHVARSHIQIRHQLLAGIFTIASHDMVCLGTAKWWIESDRSVSSPFQFADVYLPIAKDHAKLLISVAGQAQ